MTDKRPPFRRLRIAALALLCLVAFADETAVDREIMQHLDFFSQMEIAERLPLLTEFGVVLDIATKRQAAKKRETKPEDRKEEHGNQK